MLKLDNPADTSNLSEEAKRAMEVLSKAIAQLVMCTTAIVVTLKGST